MLETTHLVSRLAHHVSHALCRLQTRRTVWNDDIFRRHIYRCLAVQLDIHVHFLERVTGKAQAPQHALVLGTVLDHHFRQLIVHVITNTLSCFLDLRGLFADDLCLDRTRCGERLHHGLGLELHNCFSQDGVVHTTRAIPRFSPVFHLHAEQLKAIDICLNPLFATSNVSLILTDQLTRQFEQLAFFHCLSEVLVKLVVVFLFLFLNHAKLKAGA